VEGCGQTCVYEERPGAASAPLPRTYRQRQPQATVLHRVVRENLETFLAEGVQRSASGEGYPYYVEKEFRDYVLCGDLSRGFARVRCAACGHEIFLPFSCKNRGVCPSCTARRMSDEAAYLVDMVLPEAPYRQWTLTFPFEVRFLMARDHRLITAIFGIALRILFAWQRRCAKRAGHPGAKTAAVAFVQRFGGALNCNVHAHVLLPDGVFVLDNSDAFVFVPLPPPENKDILRLTERLARRVTAFHERRFAALEPALADVLEGAIGEGMQAVPLLAAANAAEDDTPDEEKRLQVRAARHAASVDGFSIHAATAVPARNRIGLEKLCRYGLRSAFSHERLTLSPSGQVLVGLRRPWPTPAGVSVLSFEPVAFLRRLAPLIPPPWAHLVRYYGLFAPNAKGRDLLPAAPASPHAIRIDARLCADRAVSSLKTRAVDPPASPTTPSPEPSSPASLTPASSISSSRPTPQPLAGAPTTAGSSRSHRRVLPWADLLRRVFQLDVLVCGSCGGPMTVIAYLTDPVVVEKILAHLGLPTAPPRLLPARLSPQIEMFEEDSNDHVGSAPPSLRGGRGPPSSHGDLASMDNDDTNTCEWGA
jgi:hypothetical protein